MRRRMHGDIAYFNINRHINPTNVCVYTYNCKFCSFAALPGEEHAWEMSHEDVYEHAAKQGGDAVTAHGGERSRGAGGRGSDAPRDTARAGQYPPLP